jgi:23S rRNA (uracil1939-C5)-methyltransferase
MMFNLRRELTIDRLGQRGEGIAVTPDGNVFVPYALPGEAVIAEVDGERGKLAEVAAPSAERIAPFCPHYGICGGCAVQALAAPAYQAWKRSLLVEALSHAGLTPDIAPLVDAHGAGRRRATFHARFDRDPLGKVRMDVGFMRARAHDIVDLDVCPVLAPDMAGALPAAHLIARLLSSLLKPLDIVVTATLEGLDVDIRGTGALPPDVSRKLISIADRLDLARVANHGEVLVERRPPLLKMGNASVLPPAGVFLQATLAGEEALSRLVIEAVGPAKRVADLFAGVGTFALRLCARAEVHAVETEPLALAALTRAVPNTPGSRQVTTERRDLFRRPLAGGELANFDAVVFDPPRAGAQEQAQALAASAVMTVIAVSCNVQTFSRDAKILVDGGYTFERVTPVDQFRHSPHVEMVGVFRRVKTKQKKVRRLLG